ncbi:hypothetical protein [Methylobacterium sp. ID0610]|uniref:hypothetical protein n=1 Tax=Methylobacterium carpenticola TaxID=3344827 RepID=UPI0036BBADE2
MSNHHRSMREPGEIDAAAGGFPALGFGVAGPSTFEAQTLRKGGVIAGPLTTSRSVTTGCLSFGLTV